MLESREWRGTWWDPRQPADQAAAGVLTFSQDSAALELIGTLPPLDPGANPVEALFGPLTERPRLLGITTGGDKITLDHCLPKGRTAGSGVPVESHRPGVIFVGHHFAREPRFTSLEVRFTHLDEWVGISGFSSDLKVTAENELEKISVDFRPPPAVSSELADGTLIEIGFAWRWSGQSIVTTRSEIEQEAGVIARFPEARPLDESLELATQLRNFLALGLGRPTHPREISGVLDLTGDELDDNQSANESSAPNPRVEILYSLSDDPDPARTRSRELLAHEMPFALASIRETLGERLEGWILSYGRLKPTVDLYFGVAYGALRYIQPRFLALAQALETYHRRTSPATKLPLEQHEEWLAAVLDAVPESERKRLADELRHSNELRLRARIKNVLDLCPVVTAKMVGKRSKFVHGVVTARNYLTHYDQLLEEDAPDPMELVPLSAQLSALIEMCLLREVGFSSDEIDQIFDRVGRYTEIEHLQRAVRTP